MRILFLDDDPDRHRRFKMANIGRDITYCFTYEEATVALATKPRFDVAQLDHDLSEMAAAGMPAPGELSGQDIARFIAGLAPEKRPLEVVVHSFNVKGAYEMGRILRGLPGLLVRRQRFAFPPG